MSCLGDRLIGTWRHIHPGGDPWFTLIINPAIVTIVEHYNHDRVCIYAWKLDDVNRITLADIIGYELNHSFRVNFAGDKLCWGGDTNYERIKNAVL